MAGLNLAFEHPVAPQAGTSVRFVFGGALVQPSLTLGDTLQLGSAAIRNTAFTLAPYSIPPGATSSAVVSRYASTTLAFAGAVPGLSALNVSFVFGGAQLVTTVGGVETMVFGTPEVRQPISARPEGIPPGTLGTVVVADRHGDDLHLVDPLHNMDGRMLRFDFGDAARPIVLRGIDSCEFGAVHAEVALGARPSGIGPGELGSPFVYSPFIRDGNVDFHFGDPLTGSTDFTFDKEFGIGFPGWESLELGDVTVISVRFGIHPKGIFDGDVGGHVVESLNLRVLAPSIRPATPQVSTKHWISYRTRRVTPKAIEPPSKAVPSPVLTHEVQYADVAGRGISAFASGKPRIDFAIRGIEVPFIYSTVFGRHVVATEQVIAPEGWESSEFSENAELDINLQRVFHHSGEQDTAGYGELRIRTAHLDIFPEGWYDTQFNFPVVENFTQYVVVPPQDDPNEFPNYYPFVENARRTIGPHGWLSSRFSAIGHWVWNKAVPLLPDGIPSFECGTHSVTHWERFLYAEGWDSFYNTQYTTVANAADDLHPVGWDSSEFGAPEQVLNLDRTVKHHTPHEGPEIGTAFIAYAVRYLEQRPFNDIPAAFPDVRHNPHPIAPKSIDTFVSGWHHVEEHFTVVYPKSVNVFPVPRIGEPFVQNRNLDVLVYPSDQSEFGRATVFNYTTYLELGIGDSNEWGRHRISDRRLWIAPSPLSVPKFSVVHSIRNLMPDPPSLQKIFTDGRDTGVIGRPSLRKATLYPSGIRDDGYGKPELTRNTIEILKGIFEPGQFGVPECIYPRTIAPRTIPWPQSGLTTVGESDTHTTKPRLSPYTIYAPSSDMATSQARRNHPSNGTPHVISGSTVGWNTRVTLKNRTIYPFNYQLNPATKYGDATVTLGTRFIRPNGIRSLRYGLVMFLNVPQFVKHHDAAGAEAFGKPRVMRPEERNNIVKPVGSVLTLWGNTFVENFHRTIFPVGITHRGNPQQSLATPWGKPMMGWTRWYEWTGGELTLWGKPMVSYYNRDVAPEGWDSAWVCDNDLWYFDLRMRVIRLSPQPHPASLGDTSAFGRAHVGSSTRDIAARGVLGYGSGRHKVSAVSRVSAAGIDSLVVGDIDRWEEGKVKPHGDVLGAMGTPRTGRPIRPPFAETGTCGLPRIGIPVHAVGMPELAFMPPAVVFSGACTRRVVVPAPIPDAPAMPEPQVSR